MKLLHEQMQFCHCTELSGFILVSKQGNFWLNGREFQFTSIQAKRTFTMWNANQFLCSCHYRVCHPKGFLVCSHLSVRNEKNGTSNIDVRSFICTATRRNRASKVQKFCLSCFSECFKSPKILRVSLSSALDVFYRDEK